eukprot:c14636_g1_i1 orf=259-723(-)
MENVTAVLPYAEVRIDASEGKGEESKRDAPVLTEAKANHVNIETSKIVGENKTNQSKKSPPPFIFRRRLQEVKNATPPNPVKVPPKMFFPYSDRYASPTDNIMSPISKGLLARNRKPIRQVPAVTPPKMLTNTFGEVEPLLCNAMAIKSAKSSI